MAQNILTKNNARSTLLAGINAGQTNLSVQSGHGARFSAPTGVELVKLTLYDAAGNIEICHGITRVGDSWSVIVRAQEGTAARAWNAGDGISENATAGFLSGLSQLDRTETYTAAKTFTQPITASSAIPKYVLVESDATADNGRWQLYANTEALRLAAVNDADSVESTILEVQRTGTTVDSISINTTLISTKAAATGYSRVTPNMCRVDVLPAETPLTRDTITLVTGPTGCKGLILRLMAGSVSIGAIADRWAEVYVYSDSGGTNQIAGITARGHEQVSGAGMVTCQIRPEVHVKADSSGRVWLKLVDDAGNAGIGGYLIAGYYD